MFWKEPQKGKIYVSLAQLDNKLSMRMKPKKILSFVAVHGAF